MKIGLNHVPVTLLYPPISNPWEPTAGPDAIVDIARRADALGFDWIASGDDIFITPEAAEVMGRRWSEITASIAFLAGATQRLKVLTNVLVLPHRNPIILAKALATLDFLSGGRTAFGIGIGGSVPKGFEVFKIPREERAPMTDEYIRAMKELWTSERPSFQGRYVSFDDIVFEPKPVQKPHPPIWIGGNSKAAMRRAAELGDGWIPWFTTPEELPESLEYIRQQPEFGDQSRPFDVIVFGYKLFVEVDTHRLLGGTIIPETKEQWLEEIGAYEKAGATGICIEMSRTKSLEEYLERLEWFAQEIMPLFKS